MFVEAVVGRSAVGETQKQLLLWTRSVFVVAKIRRISQKYLGDKIVLPPAWRSRNKRLIYVINPLVVY